MPPDTQLCLLAILADTGVRSTLIDWLLNYSEDMVFSSIPVEWHGIDPTHFNVAEQVTGRQNKLLFHIQTSIGEAHLRARSCVTGSSRCWKPASSQAGAHRRMPARADSRWRCQVRFGDRLRRVSRDASSDKACSWCCLRSRVNASASTGLLIR
jgi:hypothetical protein